MARKRNTTRPSFMTNITYGKTKIMDKDMYLSDNDSKPIVEDTLTRNKKHKERMEKEVRKWKNNTWDSDGEFPQMMIERFTLLSKMTHAEYEKLMEDEETRLHDQWAMGIFISGPHNKEGM